MNWNGTYETDLTFLMAWIHIGQKDNHGFIQISFPAIGHMNDDVKDITITEQEADFVYDINDQPCSFHLIKTTEGITGTMDMPSIHLHLDLKLSRICEKSNFAVHHYIIPTDNVERLKSHNDFDEETVMPRLTYELNNSQVLTFVKERGFVAENHHDFDTMRKLMKKTVELIRHDGANYTHDHENRGTIAQIMYAEKQNNYTNCRGISLIFAGILRAYGFKANHVECRPLQSDDPEIHVVCEAFVPDLKKTVMFDVSNNLIYFKAGIPLSLFELREAIANGEGETLTINKDAAHNEEEIDVIMMAAYMSKNSFFFYKAILSGEDTEIEKENAICLTSKDLLSQVPEAAVRITCNPKEFYTME